jgi:hypothetical protein
MMAMIMPMIPGSMYWSDTDMGAVVAVGVGAGASATLIAVSALELK